MNISVFQLFDFVVWLVSILGIYLDSLLLARLSGMNEMSGLGIQ